MTHTIIKSSIETVFTKTTPKHFGLLHQLPSIIQDEKNCFRVNVWKTCNGCAEILFHFMNPKCDLAFVVFFFRMYIFHINAKRVP